MDAALKTVMEVECSVPNETYNRVSSLGKEVATEDDFFQIGVKLILGEVLKEKEEESSVE